MEMDNKDWFFLYIFCLCVLIIAHYVRWGKMF
jgi:hypothetical protein